MSGTETLAPKASSVKLDDETRTRMANELGLQGGMDAIPEEIRIVAVDPKEAGHEESDVAGFATVGAALVNNNVFLNMTLTPALTPATLLATGLVSRRALNIAFYI